MNIVFIGASKFGLRCLSRIMQFPDITVAGVITANQHFKISYSPDGVKNVLHSDIQSFSEIHSIPVVVLDNSMFDENLYSKVKEWKPEIFFVIGWYHMIPNKWRELAPAYGLHASLLPDYSGGAPLVWAMINGETKTGITLFQMDSGVDSGPIAGQVEEPIYSNDTIKTLYDRIEERGLELLDTTLPDFVNGTLTLIHQDESQRKIMPQRSPADGKIDWTQSAEYIERFIRAQTKPYPGAFFLLGDKKFIIWKAHINGDGEINNAKPGHIIKNNDGSLSVSCGNGSIVIDEVSIESKDCSFTEFEYLAQKEGLLSDGVFSTE